MILRRLVEQASSLAETRLGLQYEAIGRSTIESALRTRMRLCSESPEIYLLRLLRDSDEQQALTQLLLISESWFCREMEPLQAALCALRQRTDELTILSAPCARGEEAITALFAAEQAGFSTRDIHVDGYDAAEEAVARAKRFTYHRSSFRQTQLLFETSYFEAAGDDLRLRDHLQPRILVERANLLDAAWAPRSTVYDLILCRNVLIYLTPTSQRDLVKKLMSVLAPHGLFIVAAAEAPLVSALGYKHSLSSPLIFSPRTYVPPKRSVSRSLTRKESLKAARPKLSDAPKYTSTKQSRSAPVDLDALANRGDIELAFERALDALEKTPNDPELHFLLGVISASCGHTREALSWFRQVLLLSPEHEEASLYLVLLNGGEDA